ncbi:hypothetical protein Mal52_59020 [Symmachiella dynata]|uniref:Uncharacterized protein n=1 Tax=Symmachiella dynata TaxID=2527995 RepID=A0A517ZY16_9PLAN|nr:hypothetical protein [Symmachiella dynata]QDU47373.1 hypothetical protein Mal52_59020 [Symmachiella dynata]
MTAVIGFDRKVKLDWLDAFADKVAQDQDPAMLRKYLHEYLENEHPMETARGKTITVLMRIWARVPEHHEYVRDEAFDLLKSIRAEDRIWLHWGMSLMAYPLFDDCASAIGRLLKLQDEFTLRQLHRKLIQGWGERATLNRAYQRVVRSMVDWNTVEDTEAKGHFGPAPQNSTRSKRLQIWLLKASHAAADKNMIEADELLTLPSLFPFKIAVGRADLRQCKDFTVHRQGMRMEMIEMPNGKPKPKPKRIPKKSKQRALFGGE